MIFTAVLRVWAESGVLNPLMEHFRGEDSGQEEDDISYREFQIVLLSCIGIEETYWEWG